MATATPVRRRVRHVSPSIETDRQAAKSAAAALQRAFDRRDNGGGECLPRP
ncbi:hypothetical protein [Streptomyces beihaiensis]|uniref:Uncharacterized protein n=1 Tax=Streptomyces beihaiensis TaxID=2984495 RepID=A0ABT3TT79_9ACTN|nr:hypothetical protein [Streptomyces beihaiensis]MCX3059716.1 hypothetical protein [Streptomyces beihaiensis]